MNPQIKFSGGINPALLFITWAPKALNNIPTLSHWCHQHTFVPMKKLFVRIYLEILPIFFNWITAFKKGGWADTCLLILPFILDSQIELSFVSLTISFIYTICSPTLLCVYLCFAVGYQSSRVENMAPLTRAWLAKLFTPSPSPQRQLLLNLSLSSVFLQIRMKERAR